MADGASLQVDIVSAEGQIHNGPAKMVYAPAAMGEVGIAPRHAALLTTLVPGPVRIEDEQGEEQVIYVSGGILEVQPHLVTILADTADRASDIDEAAAQEAQQRAEQAVSEATDKVDIERAQRDLIEAAARLQAVKKLKGVSR